MRLTLSLACALALCAGCAGVEAQYGVSYDDRYPAAKLDLYRPAAGGSALRPGILFVHGGAWIASQREHFSHPAERFAQSGYVTANADYRLAPESPYPAAVQDVWCALAYFRSRAGELGMDPQRVAAYGYSAGGHLVALLGLAARPAAQAPDCAAGDTGPANAVVGGAGVYDLRTLPDVPALRAFLGGTLQEQPARFAEASPLAQVTAQDPPLLLVHGTADWFVSEDQAEAMRARRAEAGNPAELLTFHSAGHVLNASGGGSEVELELYTELPEAYLAISDFLARTIGAPP